MSEQEIAYAIPGNDSGGRLFIYGKKDAKNVVIFCAGFPDDCSTFIPVAKRLSDSCLCGVTCMPGYDSHHDDFKPAGYTFDETVASLREATKTLRALCTTKNAKLTGVFHDWGSVVGAMCSTRMNMETPNYFSQLVYFDVLPPTHKSLGIKPEKTSFRKSIIFMTYTTLFATTHAIQRFISPYLAAPVAIFSLMFLKATHLLPTGKLDSITFESRDPPLDLRKMVYMQYPYFQMYKGLLFGKGFGAGMYLPADVKETPVLYMYGTDKNIQFHDENHVSWLQEQNAKGSKSNAIAVEKAGHWLYLQQPDTCLEAVKKFIFG